MKKTLVVTLLALTSIFAVSTAVSAPPVCDVLAAACGTHGGSTCELYAEKCG